MENFVAELGRQRNTNRVRAENALRGFGHHALPFVAKAASHPFELTRRAAQRIIRDAKDVRGAPLAIEALTDQDYFVRVHAHEALQGILHEAKISYNAKAGVKQLQAAQSAYRTFWLELRRAFAAERAVESI